MNHREPADIPCDCGDPFCDYNHEQPRACPPRVLYPGSGEEPADYAPGRYEDYDDE